jgi:hypothetical protein
LTIGPGKYDDLCTLVREQTDAELAIVIVQGGNRGNGFSCQVIDPALLKRMPDILENMAAQMRKDMGP